MENLQKLNSLDTLNYFPINVYTDSINFNVYTNDTINKTNLDSFTIPLMTSINPNFFSSLFKTKDNIFDHCKYTSTGPTSSIYTSTGASTSTSSTSSTGASGPTGHTSSIYTSTGASGSTGPTGHTSSIYTSTGDSTSNV